MVAAEVIEGVQVFEVADVLAQEGELVAGQAEGVLLCRAHGEDGSCPERELHRVRGIAPRPPDRLGRPAADAGDAVVVPRVDLPVVDEEIIGKAPEPPPRLLVVFRDRLFGEVAARHDEGLAEVGQQEVVERRIGKHDAQIPVSGGHEGRDGRAVLARKQHDGRFRAAKESRFRVIGDAVAPHLFHVPHHHRKGLVGSSLPLP